MCLFHDGVFIMMSAKPDEKASMEFLVETEQAMQDLAAKIASSANSDHSNSGLVIFLSGDLGTGKTTFARGFIRALGFDGIVKSPTYTFVEPYNFTVGKTCYHFDLYRLADGEELEHIGARDYFDEQSICLIEWPEKAEAYLPEPDISCSFTVHERGRQVKIVSLSEKGKSVMLRITSNSSL